MCGRYVHPDDAAIERAWHVRREDSNPFARRFNVAPTMLVPVLRRRRAGADLTLTGARWGLIPHWWAQASAPKAAINARAEEAAAKPMWRTPYRQARALIPADSWYEWQTRERVDQRTGAVRRYKQPFSIHRDDERPFCFAGLLSLWRAPGAAAATLTCAILTKAASPALAALHERMPVVLADAAFAAWTEPALQDPAALDQLLADYALGDFVFHPVSALVNDSKIDDQRLIQAVPIE